MLQSVNLYMFDSFRGSTKGKGGHDEVARRIASNGQCWVERSRSDRRVVRGLIADIDILCSVATGRHAGVHVSHVPRVRPADEPRQR